MLLPLVLNLCDPLSDLHQMKNVLVVTLQTMVERLPILFPRD